jgi:arylsulfatase A-like enzyme
MRPVHLLAALWATFASLAGAEQKPTNVLFVIADDWGHGHAGAYGCPWVKTPNFDRVAKEGLLFLNAYTPTAKCSPSRSAILTGRHPWLLGAAANHQCVFPPEHEIFPDVLERNGYAYASCGKVWAPGLSLKADGSKRRMDGKLFNRRLATPPATGMAKTDYAANFHDFLEQSKPDQPWFFWLGFHEPHREYEQGSGLRLGKKLSDVDHVPAYWPDNAVIRGDMLDYALEVEHCDRHLGLILDDLEKRGELDRTLIIVTSDNGMPFPRVKGSTYEDANHLPMAARWPAGIKNPGRKVSDYISFADFAPTFLEVASPPHPGVASPTSSGVGSMAGAIPRATTLSLDANATTSADLVTLGTRFVASSKTASPT